MALSIKELASKPNHSKSNQTSQPGWDVAFSFQCFSFTRRSFAHSAHHWNYWPRRFVLSGPLAGKGLRRSWNRSSNQFDSTNANRPLVQRQERVRQEIVFALRRLGRHDNDSPDPVEDPTGRTLPLGWPITCWRQL